MRRLLVVGAVSLASALAASCGDDDGDGGGGAGTGGNGGSSGASGGNGGSSGASGGNGGSSGSAGASGGSAGATGGSAGATGGSAGSSAGTAGSGTVDPDAGPVDASTGDAGDGGGPPPCTGCVELRVPFTASNQAAFFQIQFSARSLADTVATFRVRTTTLDETGQTYVYAFATDSDTGDTDFTQAAGAFTLINAANFTDTNTLVDITLDLTTFSNVDFDESEVIALGLQVGSGGDLAGPLTTVLLVDGLTLSGTSGLPNLTFTASAEGFAPNAFAGLQTTTLIHHPE